MPDSNLIKLKYKTYIKMIENSPGTRIFNSTFVRNKETGEEFDVLEDGVYSGAFFVSSVLTLLEMIDKPHSTVATVTEKFKEAEDWQEISLDDLKAGDVLTWEEMEFEDGTRSDQIGFYLDKNSAVSTSKTERKVIKHHPTFGVKNNGDPNRKITGAYRYKFEE